MILLHCMLHLNLRSEFSQKHNYAIRERREGTTKCNPIRSHIHVLLPGTINLISQWPRAWLPLYPSIRLIRQSKCHYWYQVTLRKMKWQILQEPKEQRVNSSILREWQHYRSYCLISIFILVIAVFCLTSQQDWTDQLYTQIVKQHKILFGNWLLLVFLPKLKGLIRYHTQWCFKLRLAFFPLHQHSWFNSSRAW